MLDLSRPEIRQAYLIGVDAGKASLGTELDRVAQVTETRIVRELEKFRLELVGRRSSARARVVAQAIALIQGEDYDDSRF
jgi:hypothetical protein